jgi:hypothetical protein
VALCAFLLLLAVFAQASSARSRAGCGGEPGSPDRGAVFQYCPSEVKKAAPSTGTGTGGGSGDAAEPVALAPRADSDDGPGGSPDAGPKIPLTDYPSSGGVNALLIALLLAIAIAVAYGARRRRRGSAEAP